VNKDGFELFIYICIIINTVILACNWYGMKETTESAMGLINQIFTAIFSMEALMKIIAFGSLYFRKAWNVFDFAILVLTIVQIVASLSNFTSEFTLYVTILRVLKLLKTARLFKKANSIKNIARTLLMTFPNLTNIAFLLFLLMIFYAILGMNIFGRVMLHGALND
jgi:Ion transport protein